MRRFVAVSLAAVLVLRGGTAHGGEDPPAGEPVRIDLSAFHAAPAVAFSRQLYVPTDAAFAEAWRNDGSRGASLPDEAVIAAFQEPPHPDHALSPEAVEDLVRRLVPAASGGGWASKATPRGLDVWATPAAGEAARKAVVWLESAFAPRLSVSAMWVAREGPPGGRLVAAGSASLMPRRWTAVWMRHAVRRYVAGYDVEIAQEAVANAPAVAALPEGEELYLRWTPGETVSILEVYEGEVAHLASTVVDLAGVRNAPEVNSQGRVELPRTSVRRAQTAILVPAAGAPKLEIVFDGPSGERTLRLSVAAAPPAAADMDLAGGRVGVVRAGASASVLEDGSRDGGIEEAIARFQSALAATGASTKSLEAHEQSLLLCEGGTAEVDGLRAATRRSEAGLVAFTLELRVVAVAAAAVMRELDSGRAGVGRPLTPEAATALQDGRGQNLGSVALPVVGGVRASVRLGTSVTGFVGPQAAIAQVSAALRLDVGAWFDGLAVQATPAAFGGGGARLRVLGTRGWARADGSVLELAYRPPVTLAPSSAAANGGYGVDPLRFPVPLAAHGQSAFDATATWTPAELGEGRPALLAVLGAPPAAPGAEVAPEVVLLLATLKK